MEWKQLISNKRFGQEHKHAERHDDRSEFKRDYDRLIFSSAFRRLQNKTQVFPLPGSIFVHNRLTHSLEVSSVGMSLGNDISRRIIQKRPELKDTLFEEIGTIVSAACLAHDLGNPPFGHSGEKAIQTFFSEGAGQNLKSANNSYQTSASDRSISMPNATTIALNSSAITTASSSRRRSAGCRTRRRYSRCRAASSYTTDSPTAWKYRAWACRWATTSPAASSRSVRS